MLCTLNSCIFRDFCIWQSAHFMTRPFLVWARVWKISSLTQSRDLVPTELVRSVLRIAPDKTVPPADTRYGKERLYNTCLPHPYAYLTSNHLLEKTFFSHLHRHKERFQLLTPHNVNIIGPGSSLSIPASVRFSVFTVCYVSHPWRCAPSLML